MAIQNDMRYYNREMHLNNIPTLKLKIKKKKKKLPSQVKK